MFDFNYFHSWDIKYLFIFLILLILISILGNRKILRLLYSFLFSLFFTLIILASYIYISYYPNLIRYHYNSSNYKEVIDLYKSYSKLKINRVDRSFFNDEKQKEIKDSYIISLFLSNKYKKVLPLLEERYKESQGKEKVFWGIYLSYTYFYLEDFRSSHRVYQNSYLLALSILNRDELILFKGEISMMNYFFY